MKCRYCDKFYHEKDSEHVFPLGLGGQDIFMDCVCKTCNNSFSDLETELLQNSPIAFMRSVEGLSKFNAPVQLLLDEKLKIVIEVGQLKGIQIYPRPQLMIINDKYRVLGDAKEIEEFSEMLKKWKETNNLKVITEYPDESGKVSYVQFKRENDHFSINKNEAQFKITDEITIRLLDKTDSNYDYLTPRLFVDDRNPKKKKKKLKIRAKSQADAIDFIKNYLNFELANKETNDPVENYTYKTPEISVGIGFSESKVERALVKIGLNCLMYYFPNAKNEPSIDECISYVKTGSRLIQARVEEKNNIKDSQENTHNVFFCQMDNSVDIRLSLFNGKFVYGFFIPSLCVLKPNEYSRLVIDYNKRVNKFENKKAFWESFSSK